MTDIRKPPPPHGFTTRVADVGIPIHCESSKHYQGVLIQFDERWRLIVCGKKYQVILQRRGGPHGGAWRGFKYFITKNGILQTCGRLDLLSHQTKAIIEKRLPVNFGRIGK